MREIKFGGKREDNGEWVYGYYVKDPKGQSRIYTQPFDGATSNTYFVVDPKTVGQYIGKKDDNDEEIYFGDFVRYDHEDGPVTALVKWKESDEESMWLSGFYFEFISRGEHNGDEAVKFERIGNIHSNPELWK